MLFRSRRTRRGGARGRLRRPDRAPTRRSLVQIEKFTRQQIPVQILEGFGPEEGEKAEPIAMGRQTLWGGLGKPPGREVMQAAARAARQEMMQRIRDNKAALAQRKSAVKPAQSFAAKAAEHASPAEGAENSGEQATAPAAAGKPAPGKSRNRYRNRRSGESRSVQPRPKADRPARDSEDDDKIGRAHV